MTSPTIPQSLQPPARQPTVREQQIIKQYGSVESYQQAVAGTEIEKRISKVVSDINTGKITSESQIPSDLKQFIDVGDYFQKVTEYKAKLESYNESIRRQAEAKQVENFIRRGKEGEIARGGTPYQRQLLRDAKQRQAILSEYYQEPIPLSPWTKFNQLQQQLLQVQL